MNGCGLLGSSQNLLDGGYRWHSTALTDSAREDDMIKKTLRNAAVGTLAAGAMILPAATTVAPQLQLVACDYPDSRDTATTQELSK